MRMELRVSCCAALALAACVESPTVVIDETEAPRVVARVETVDGARVTFYDESDGGGTAIGIEIASSTTTPATDRVLAADPTALELYLAIAPIAKPPQVLLDDHALSRAEPPRTLKVAMSVGEEIDPYDCDDVATWEGQFLTWAGSVDYKSSGWETATTNGYVGYAPTFFFDVCRPTDMVVTGDYWVAVERRITSGGTWVRINTMPDIEHQDRRWRYRRSSNTCTSFQYRLHVNPGANGRYRRAARWDDEWNCAIQS